MLSAAQWEQKLEDERFRAAKLSFHTQRAPSSNIMNEPALSTSGSLFVCSQVWPRLLGSKQSRADLLDDEDGDGTHSLNLSTHVAADVSPFDKTYNLHCVGSRTQGKALVVQLILLFALAPWEHIVTGGLQHYRDGSQCGWRRGCANMLIIATQVAVMATLEDDAPDAPC